MQLAVQLPKEGKNEFSELPWEGKSYLGVAPGCSSGLGILNPELVKASCRLLREKIQFQASKI